MKCIQCGSLDLILHSKQRLDKVIKKPDGSLISESTEISEYIECGRCGLKAPESTTFAQAVKVWNNAKCEVRFI
jgi:hypothetical protein